MFLLVCYGLWPTGCLKILVRGRGGLQRNSELDRQTPPVALARVPVPCDWCSPPGLCPAQVRMGKCESRSVVSWGLAVWSSECRVRYFIELLPNWVFFPCPHFLLLWFCSSWCCCILRVRVYGLIFMCIFLRDFVCGKETTYK